MNQSTCDIVTPPTFSALVPADMRTWLNTNDETEDIFLSDLALAAADEWTNETGHVLCSTGFRLYLDNFPMTYNDGQAWRYGNGQEYGQGFYPWGCRNTNPPSLTIYLPRYPVSAVTSVEYLDTNGSWQTLLGCTYDTAGKPARVVLPTSLPQLHPTQRPCVRVNFTAGYSDAASIPRSALVAIRLLAAHWYNNSTGDGGAYTTDDLKELPHGWERIASRWALQLSGDWNR